LGSAQSSLVSGSRFHLLLIALVAVVAMSPELVLGLTMSDSFRYNLLWPEQFAALFREGHLYPRWLPHAWGGLGNPTFYFYPPLFFWVTALIDAATFGALTPERFTPLATLVVLAVSGFTMQAWLRTKVSPRRALLGAFAYMIAPYHLYDIYTRGALAEAAAYAGVPLIALALTRLRAGRTRAVPLLAIGYGALLLTHLPSALLVTVFLIVPYVVFEAVDADRRVRFLVLALAGGLLGIGLAAIYLMPALGLLRYASADALSASFYRPENWFFWHVNAGQFSNRMLLIVPVSLAAALFAAGAAIAARARPDRRESLFWAALTIALVVVIAGLIPPIWKLPGLALVQFPWRALLIVEFTAVTVIAMTAPSLRKPLIFAGAATLVFAYVILGFMMVHLVEGTRAKQESAAAEIRRQYADAPEYLPAGTVIVQGNGPAPEHVELPSLRTARAADPRTRVAVAAASDGAMGVLIDSPAPTEIILPRFYFPHWQLRDGAGPLIPIAPTPTGRLVSFHAPAGRTSFRLSLGSAPYERTGDMVSLVTLLLLGAAFIMTRTRLSVAPSLLKGNAIG
jgi:hypothetical protein